MAARWLKFSAMLIGCFLALIAAVMTVFYDADYMHAVRSLLLAGEGCSAPCLMDIRPGVTNYDEGWTILNANTWVKSTNINVSSLGFGTLHWRWSGLQPGLINPNHNGMAQINNQTIESLLIRTRIRFGDVWLAFGEPERGGADLRYHIADYPRSGFSIRTYMECEDFWHAPVDVFVARWHADFNYDTHQLYDYKRIRQLGCQGEG